MMCRWENVKTDFGGNFRVRYDELSAATPVAIRLLDVAYDSDGYRTILVPSPGSWVEVKVTPGEHEPRRAVRQRGRRATIDSPAAYAGQPFRITPVDRGYWTLSCDSDRCAECLHEAHRCGGYQQCWFCHVERHETEACGDDFLTCTWCNQDRHEEGDCGNDLATCFTCRAAAAQAA